MQICFINVLETFSIVDLNNNLDNLWFIHVDI